MIAPASSLPTYVWHYVVARLIYDHLVVVVVAVVVVLVLRGSRRR